MVKNYKKVKKETISSKLTKVIKNGKRVELKKSLIKAQSVSKNQPSA